MDCHQPRNQPTKFQNLASGWSPTNKPTKFQNLVSLLVGFLGEIAHPSTVPVRLHQNSKTTTRSQSERQCMDPCSASSYHSGRQVQFGARGGRKKCFGFQPGRPIEPQPTRPRLAKPDLTCAETSQSGARFGRWSGKSPEVKLYQGFETKIQNAFAIRAPMRGFWPKLRARCLLGASTLCSASCENNSRQLQFGAGDGRKKCFGLQLGYPIEPKSMRPGFSRPLTTSLQSLTTRTQRQVKPPHGLAWYQETHPRTN